MSDRDDARAAVFLATDPALNRQARLLRASVEAGVSKPAIVMITSAAPGDGKSLTASMLAASLEKCDYRVSLVEIPNETGTSPECLTDYVERMRANYDFTVIDAAAYLENTTVLSLARLVDAIVVAVRIGRTATADDGSMVATLEEFGGNVLGVVATDADAIAMFERTRRDSPMFTRLQPRRTAEQTPTQAVITAAAEPMFR
jgi:Mrp family chromosome partitioning ATPase